MIVLDLLIVYLAFTHVLYFLRLFETLCNMVHLLSMVVNDLFPFAVFYFLGIFMFSLIDCILRVQHSNVLYPGLNHFFSVLINTFLNSSGNPMFPTYDYWLQDLDESPN